MFGPLDFLDDLFGGVSEVLGWTWEKVITGIFTWFARGVLLLMEWVFGQLDTATSPRLTDDWFANGLVREVALIGLAITVMMMLISAIQMGWAGRPELFGDAIRNGAKSILGSALVVVLIDGSMQMADALTATIWSSGRSDVLSLLDGSASAITVGAEVVGLTFLGPLLILMGMVGFLLITGVLFFRSVMIYLVAAFAPIPLALAAGTTFRGATRRVVSLTLSLVLAKPAVVLTLVVGAKVTSNAGTDAGGTTEGLGALVTGFLVFLIAAFAPILIFKLLPMVGDATMTSGVLAGVGRSAMTVAQAGMIASSVGGAAAGSAATRATAGQASGGTGGGGAASSSAAGGGSSAGGGLSGAHIAALPMGGAAGGASASSGGASVGGAGGSLAAGSSGSGQSTSGPQGLSSGWSAANQTSPSRDEGGSTEPPPGGSNSHGDDPQ